MGHPNLFSYLVLVSFLPVTLGLFSWMPAHKAVLWTYLMGLLFLPMTQIPIAGIINVNKFTITGVGVLLGAMLFDIERVLSFSFKFWDLPALVWCLCPIMSSIHNGLGVYDGIATAAGQSFLWGTHYLVGRLYFNDLPGLRDLATAVVVGGLLYVPLCLFEVRFSPQLHRFIYGFHQYDFAQVRRYGAFRPMVFLQTGLAVGMWMAAASVTAFWLTWSKTRRRLLGIPMWFNTCALFATTVLCRSTGSIILMAVGIVVLVSTRLTRTGFLVVVLALAPGIYMFVRATNLWTGEALVKQIDAVNYERGSSLGIRLKSERLFVDKADKSFTWGWGGWDRFRSTEGGIPDALWIIAFGHNGIVGLIAVSLMIVVPLLLLLWKIPARYWSHPGAAPAAALAVVLGMHMCDNLMNAMINPIFLLAAGGITGLAFSMRHAIPMAHGSAASRGFVAGQAQSVPMGGGAAVARI